MTIYSIIPEDQIFEGYEDFNPQYMEIQVNGISMQIERINSKQAKIVRVISCNAYDYLNPAYAPGSVLEFEPAFV